MIVVHHQSLKSMCEGLRFVLHPLLAALWMGALACGEPPLSSKTGEFEESLGKLFKTEAGYTLIGKKPISVDISFEHSIREHREELREFLLSAFRDSESFILQWPEGEGSFALIHKAALAKVIRENKELCDFVAKKFSSVETLFSHLQTSQENLFKTFDFDDFLLGLVLGYGRTNSEYYCRKGDVGGYLSASFCLAECLGSSFRDIGSMRIYFCSGNFFQKIDPMACYKPFLAISFFLNGVYKNEEIPVPKQEFGSLETELKWLRNVEWKVEGSRRTAPPYNLDYPLLPFYTCRHGGDSEQVYQKYLKARDRLADLFCRRCPSEVVLEKASK